MTLRVLQFSDIHFSTEHSSHRRLHQDVRDQVLHDLEKLQIKEVGAIIIAGDVAFSGKRAEYQQASDWIERIRALTGCPLHAVLPVPGNHDVDRDRIRTSTRLVHSTFRFFGVPQIEQELARLAKDSDPCLLEKLADYQSFAASYGCFFDNPSIPAWSRIFELGPKRNLAIRGLTTVQVCDASDAEGAMLLGSEQYIFPEIAGTEQIVVMHHPIDWLKDKREASPYFDSRARILIVGHEHEQDLKKISTTDGNERLLIASGALTPPEANEPFLYRYNILDFDTNDIDGHPVLAVTVRPRKWSKKHTAFRRDYECLEDGDSATINLKCPQFARASGATSQVPSDSVTRLRYLFWQRLEWRARMRVLAQINLLPAVPEAPLPHAVEEKALASAQVTNQLAKIWQAMMTELPAQEQEACPFVVTED